MHKLELIDSNDLEAFLKIEKSVGVANGEGK